MTDMLVVDADGHVCEPPDLWTANLPPSMREDGITLRWNADSGWDECWAEGRILVNRGLPGLGNAGLSFENFGQGMHYEDLNPAGFDPAERIKVLDAEGIHISVLYPGLGLKLGGLRDPALAVESCKVYNDWIADYARAAPTRLAGVGALPLQDPVASVGEVARIKELGLVAGFCRPNPHGGEPLHSPVFDPVWSALEEADLPLAFHPAGVSDMDGTALRMTELMAPGTQHAVILLFDQYMTLSNLVYAGVLERHPDLKVAVLECGGGWIGHWMDRLNEFHDSYKWAAAPISLKPSEYFQRQCVVSFDPGEHTHKLLADFAGAHTFIWASDFPHNDAKYPGVVDELLEHSEGMADADRAGLVGTNALALYRIESMADAAQEMTYDLVVRGGHVCDGTGAPSFVADIAVHEGTVVAIGQVDPSDAVRVIEADGLWVTPGFVDIHTHYDAQLHFEPTASPSSWHGTTTVFIGNCGFTFAPAKPDDLPWLLQMLSRVEGMSPEALQQAVTFSGGSFADYLHGFEGQIGVNVGANVGHYALRRFVMGDAASEREATQTEIAQMQELLREALADGAIGFTSSQLELHQAHDGRPVPSNLAAPEEIVALASVLAEFGFGSIEFIPKTFLEGYSVEDRDLILQLWRVSGKPVHLNTLTRLPQAPDGWKRSLEFASEALATEGAQIHPMFAANHQGVHFALSSTFLFDEYLTLRAALTAPPAVREATMRSAEFRAALREDLADVGNRSFTFRPQVLRVEIVHKPEHERYVGMTITEMAADMGCDPLDAFLDVSLAEGLQTQFVQAAPPDQGRIDAIEELIRSGIITAGASDAGAHLLSFCGVDYTTRLLTEWVPHVLSFEEAVHRVTMAPAQLYGLHDRGVITVGAAADLNVIDRARLATCPPRFVTDFPADSGRFVIDAEGYVATVVNGTVMMEEGKHTGALPGRVLRGA